jgi:phage-related protein
MQAGTRIIVRFYKASNGKEPVREWLKEQTKEHKKLIGEDIKTVENTWPVGIPLVRKLDKDLWEVRTTLEIGKCRVFFTIWQNYMVLLHSIIKKTQKTPKQDLDLAKSRRNNIYAEGVENE